MGALLRVGLFSEGITLRILGNIHCFRICFLFFFFFLSVFRHSLCLNTISPPPPSLPTFPAFRRTKGQQKQRMRHKTILFVRFTQVGTWALFSIYIPTRSQCVGICHREKSNGTKTHWNRTKSLQNPHRRKNNRQGSSREFLGIFKLK